MQEQMLSRSILIRNDDVKITVIHNHKSDLDLIETLKIKNKTKEPAVTTRTILEKLGTQMTIDLSEEELLLLKKTDCSDTGKGYRHNSMGMQDMPDYLRKNYQRNTFLYMIWVLKLKIEYLFFQVNSKNLCLKKHCLDTLFNL